MLIGAAANAEHGAAWLCALSLSTCCHAGIILTNDGNAILREIDVAHPAAKVSTELAMPVQSPPTATTHGKHLRSGSAARMQSIIELSRTQDEEVGDGTTSVIILGEKHCAPFCAHASALVPPSPSPCHAFCMLSTCLPDMMLPSLLAIPLIIFAPL